HGRRIEYPLNQSGSLSPAVERAREASFEGGRVAAAASSRCRSRPGRVELCALVRVRTTAADGPGKSAAPVSFPPSHASASTPTDRHGQATCENVAYGWGNDT